MEIDVGDFEAIPDLKEVSARKLQNSLVGKRDRKTREQLSVLESEFLLNPDKWSIDHCLEIAARIGMVRQTVSKWNWDRRKKCGLNTSRTLG